MPKIVNLPHYPEDGNHQQVVTPDNFPLRITKGEDWTNDKRHLWVVYPAVKNYKHGDFQRASEWFKDLPTSYHKNANAAYLRAKKDARDAAKSYLEALPS